MHLNRGFLPALLLSSTLATSVHADPVEITSGFLSAEGAFAFADFEFVGANFFAAGGAEPGVIGPAQCFPCSSADLISMNTDYSGTIGSGTATIGGTTYEDVTFGGELMFRSAAVAPPSTPTSFQVIQGFTFTGFLMGFLNYNTSSEQIVFQQDLTGSGTVTASFSTVPNVGTPIFNFNSVRYDFASDAAVPEPTTLLLVATGLGAAVARKKRRNDLRRSS